MGFWLNMLTRFKINFNTAQLRFYHSSLSLHKWSVLPPILGPDYNHNTPTTLRTSVKELLQMHFKVAVIIYMYTFQKTFLAMQGQPRQSTSARCAR